MVFYCFLPGCAGRLRGLELFAGLKDGTNTKPVNLHQSRRSAAGGLVNLFFWGGGRFCRTVFDRWILHEWPAGYLPVQSAGSPV